MWAIRVRYYVTAIFKWFCGHPRVRASRCMFVRCVYRRESEIECDTPRESESERERERETEGEMG